MAFSCPLTIHPLHFITFHYISRLIYRRRRTQFTKPLQWIYKPYNSDVDSDILAFGSRNVHFGKGSLDQLPKNWQNTQQSLKSQRRSLPMPILLQYSSL